MTLKNIKEVANKQFKLVLKAMAIVILLALAGAQLYTLIDAAEWVKNAFVVVFILILAVVAFE